MVTERANFIQAHLKKNHVLAGYLLLISIFFIEYVYTVENIFTYCYTFSKGIYIVQTTAHLVRNFIVNKWANFIQILYNIFANFYIFSIFECVYTVKNYFYVQLLI